MGVRLLAHTGSGPEAIQARLDEYGAKRSARWQVTCTYLRPAPTHARDLDDLFQLQSSERPAEVLTFSARDGTLLEAGEEFSSVVDDMQTHVRKLKVSAEGSENDCGDFVVRLGQLFLNGKLEGTVLEVEFRPCTQPSGAALLREFLSTLLPKEERDFVSTDEAFTRARELPRQFGPPHSVCQFIDLMRQRKFI